MLDGFLVMLGSLFVVLCHFLMMLLLSLITTFRSLRDRSRVVPRSDSACVFTKRERSANAGFTQLCRVIGEHVSHPLVGWRSSDQDGWGLRSNLNLSRYF